MKLSSTDIAEGQPIDLRHAEPGAGGQNISPALEWSEVPQAAQSFALTCYDPDAPTGSGWWHWIVIDIPLAMTSLGSGQATDLGSPIRQWVTDYGYAGYGGPYPPPGPPHHYEFTVHALDVDRLDLDDEAPSAVVRMQLLSHSLESATITGTFATSPQK